MKSKKEKTKKVYEIKDINRITINLNKEEYRKFLEISDSYGIRPTTYAGAIIKRYINDV